MLTQSEKLAHFSISQSNNNHLKFSKKSLEAFLPCLLFLNSVYITSDWVIPVKLGRFFFIEGARRLSTFWASPVMSGQLGKTFASVGVTGPAGTPTLRTETQADFSSYLLLSVLMHGSCQWNSVVARTTAALDWFLMAPVRTPNSV